MRWFLPHINRKVISSLIKTKIWWVECNYPPLGKMMGWERKSKVQSYQTIENSKNTKLKKKRKEKSNWSSATRQQHGLLRAGQLSEWSLIFSSPIPDTSQSLKSCDRRVVITKGCISFWVRNIGWGPCEPMRMWDVSRELLYAYRGLSRVLTDRRIEYPWHFLRYGQAYPMRRRTFPTGVEGAWPTRSLSSLKHIDYTIIIWL